MRRCLVVVAIGLPLILWGHHVQAQTIEQERRVEEEKRQSLKPTVITPTAPAIVKEAPQEAPIPQPFLPMYVIHLLQKRIAYRYDAAKVIVILKGVDEELIDLGSQVAYLQEHKFIPKRLWEDFDPMQPLRKGLVAYMLLQALEIKGGIALHLLGPSERYALKELAFHGIMSPGHVDDLVGGSELVEIFAQAAKYLEKRSPQGQVVQGPRVP